MRLGVGIILALIRAEEVEVELPICASTIEIPEAKKSIL